MEANNVQHSEKRNAHWCFEGNSACEREDGNRRRWDGISPTQKPPTDPPNYVTSVPLIVSMQVLRRDEQREKGGCGGRFRKDIHIIYWKMYTFLYMSD